MCGLENATSVVTHGYAHVYLDYCDMCIENIISQLVSVGVHDQYDTAIYPSQGQLQPKDQKSLGQRAYELGSKLISKVIGSGSAKEKEKKEAVEEVAKVFPVMEFKVPLMSNVRRQSLNAFMKDHAENLVGRVDTILNPDSFIRDVELIYNSLHTQVLHDGTPSKKHLHTTKQWKHPGIKQVRDISIVYICILPGVMLSHDVLNREVFLFYN